MNPFIVFDIIATAIFAIILVSIYYRRMTKGLENVAFILVVWISLFTTILDICMESSHFLVTKFSFGVFLSYFFSYIYFMARQVMVIAYIILIFVQSDTMYKMKKTIYKVFLTFPFVLSWLVIFSNLITGKVFSIAVPDGYKRGPHMPFLYIYSILCGVFGFIYLIRMRRYLGKAKLLAMISSYVLLLASAIVQFLFPGVLLEMLSTAITLLLVHLVVYRSEEMFNHETGLYNRVAYKRQLSGLILSRRSATVLAVNFANAYETRKFFGDEKYFEYIKVMVDMVNDILKKIRDHKVFYQSDGSIQIVFTGGVIDVEEKFPELIDIWFNDVSDSYISVLDPKICIADFPSDFMNVTSFIQFTSSFVKYLKQGECVLHAKDVTTTDTFKIQESISEIITRGIKNSNFEVYYQPIYDLKKKKFASAEALVRLKDTMYGLLSPGLFIPAAEKMGLILPIGNFVMEKVFEFVGSTEFEYLGLDYIELNLSVEQLLQNDLEDRIDKLQEKYKVKPERVNLEITESVAGMHSRTGLNNVETLIRKNYSFSLDDYGTGYSNIKRAMLLPLSLVKIDKSIIDIVNTDIGATIVRNIISMMHEVGFKIVCEGVETEEQCKILETLDCDYIQGFYFAKPMCLRDFTQFLKRNNK